MRIGIALAAALALILSACSPASQSEPSAGASSASAEAAPAGVGTTSRSSGRPAAPLPGQDQALVAQGKVIFDQTAGGVGCAYCHGLDGKGKAEFASPDIRGKAAKDVVEAMATRPLMSIVKLSDEEVRAVVAYLGALPR